MGCLLGTCGYNVASKLGFEACVQQVCIKDPISTSYRAHRMLAVAVTSPLLFTEIQSPKSALLDNGTAAAQLCRMRLFPII